MGDVWMCVCGRRCADVRMCVDVCAWMSVDVCGCVLMCGDVCGFVDAWACGCVMCGRVDV